VKIQLAPVPSVRVCVAVRFVDADRFTFSFHGIGSYCFADKLPDDQISGKPYPRLLMSVLVRTKNFECFAFLILPPPWYRRVLDPKAEFSPTF